MNKIIYTRPDDGGVTILIPTPKEILEKVHGEMTDEQYEHRVRTRSIPMNAINVRDIFDVDIPQSRELRDAWCDVTPQSSIDISCQKAKDIYLEKLRQIRDEKLKKSDLDLMIANEFGDIDEVERLKTYREQLRNATETLKAIDAAGKVNDKELLDFMKAQFEVLR